MKKRLVSVVLSVLLVLTGSTALAEPAYTVGICQILTHEAVDQAALGFMDALDELLGKGTVAYELKDASGDTAICSLIIVCGSLLLTAASKNLAMFCISKDSRS